MLNFPRVIAITISITAFFSTTAFAGEAPDSTQVGPFTAMRAEYHFPASIDSDVLASAATEIWASFYYPKEIISANNRLPLVVMLHGNHATCGIGENPRMDSSCQYTDSGTCPAGYVPVPNHEGYRYLAENLASWGMIVVSINANRGITCGSGNDGDWGLNIARGRLVLKHLSLLYQWASIGGAPDSIGLGDKGLVNKIDFKSIGLFGHSRGGEGVRAAYNLYKDKASPWPALIPGLTVKGIFEVGAVDGQTSRTFDADGTVWNQLLPMCDGDVSSLEGRYPFDRMMTHKEENKDAQISLYEVWGANHNYFNTEWQSSDTSGCEYGKAIFDMKKYFSRDQQTIALASVPAFFRSHLGNQPSIALNENFNPLDQLPAAVKHITEVDRDFTPSPGQTEMLRVDEFNNQTGTNTSGNANRSSNVVVSHQQLESYRDQRVARVIWKKAAKNAYFEMVWAEKNKGKDIRNFTTIDIRVGRLDSQFNSQNTTDWSVILTDASGKQSNAVHVSDYAIVTGPGNRNPILMTVRIPLSQFTRVDMANINSVRFQFDRTPTGDLYFANVRVHKQFGLGEQVAQKRLYANLSSSPSQSTPIALVDVPLEMNKIVRVKSIGKSFVLSGKSGVEITLSSQEPFPVMDRLPLLKVGEQTFKLSRYTDMSTLKEITFTLSDEQYRSISKSAEITIQHNKVWHFGSLATVH